MMCSHLEKKASPDIHINVSRETFIKGVIKMDINTIAQIFSNLGVPVACLAVTFYLWYNETNAHKEEMIKMTDALNNNTLILQKLLDKLNKE